MTKPVRITPGARGDLVETELWYESQSDGLGRAFLSVVDDAFRTLSDGPLAFPEVYDVVRRYVLERFPYLIFYVVEEDEIVVLAVLHERRSPERWPRG